MMRFIDILVVKKKKNKRWAGVRYLNHLKMPKTPESPTRMYTMAASQGTPPKSNATRSQSYVIALKLASPTSNQFTAPTMTRIFAILSSALISVYLLIPLSMMPL